MPPPADRLLLFLEVFDELHIINLAVAPDMRRRGLGRRSCGSWTKVRSARAGRCSKCGIERGAALMRAGVPAPRGPAVLHPPVFTDAAD
jgi:hypothetical protein